MISGTPSESFSNELDQLASSMASGPGGNLVNLSRVAVDPMTSSAVRVEVDQAQETIGEHSPLERVRQAGMSKWLEGSSGSLEDLTSIRRGEVRNATVITPALGISGRNLARRDLGLARDISTVRSTAGIGAILRTIGFGEEDAKRIIDEQLPNSRKEVYVTNEGGQVIVSGKVLDIPGKGSIHIQELAPQGYFMDSQVIFAPTGSQVVPRTSTN